MTQSPGSNLGAVVNEPDHEAYLRKLDDLPKDGKKPQDESLHQMLILLRDELYGGSWDSMTQDLEKRRKKRPYIYKIVKRIEEDLPRIEVLTTYEKKYGINLANYFPKEEE